MTTTEITKVSEQYDHTLTPETEAQWARHEDAESEEDTFDSFIRNGQYPLRYFSMDRS